MMGNEVYYKEVEGVNEKWFLPRKEAVDYMKRDQDEEALLAFIENNYIFDNEDDEDETGTEPPVELQADEFIAKFSNQRKSYATKLSNLDSWKSPKKSEFFTDTPTKKLLTDVIS